MKPFIHADISVKKFGGKSEDYQDIHDFLDFSKAGHPDMRHRAVTHHSIGCYLVELAFGVTRINSDNKVYSPRDVAEQHILDDLGCIPTLSQWLDLMPLESWMGQPIIRSRTVSLKD